MNGTAIILEGIPALPLATRCYNKPGGAIWVGLLGDAVLESWGNIEGSKSSHFLLFT